MTPSTRPRHGPVRSLKVIGWIEYVQFLDWGIPPFKAKVDTGARTSALHVDDVRPLSDGRVSFEVVVQRSDMQRVRVVAPILRRTRIRSSTGVYRRRYVVPARILVGPVEKVVEVSLVSRDKMLFRMLLGRSAFSQDFLIDAGRQCLWAPRKVAPPASGGPT